MERLLNHNVPVPRNRPGPTVYLVGCYADSPDNGPLGPAYLHLQIQRATTSLRMWSWLHQLPSTPKHLYVMRHKISSMLVYTSYAEMNTHQLARTGGSDWQLPSLLNFWVKCEAVSVWRINILARSWSCDFSPAVFHSEGKLWTVSKPKKSSHRCLLWTRTDLHNSYLRGRHYI